MFVVSQGLEPCQTEPKPVVLPLHHETGVKNITYLHRQVMMVQMCGFVSQAGFEPTRFAEQRDSFPYIRFNGQTHRFPPFPLLGVGQLCLPVSPLRQMAVL